MQMQQYRPPSAGFSSMQNKPANIFLKRYYPGLAVYNNHYDIWPDFSLTANSSIRIRKIRTMIILDASSGGNKLYEKLS